MNCDAKIRPFPDATELQCEVLHTVQPVDDAATHRATLRNYAYPGSMTGISWRENDRRTFRGQWAPCANRNKHVINCVLPAGHRGGCAS
jgi:hypothetical protein